ncbi:MAG: hypothetical protein IT204_18310 [Fimbriimonadaceae bacterium]|nr:hypothetical protein [Fimbriimonadaceae bacterium]
MASQHPPPAGRQQLRGDLARWFVLGSLAYSGCETAELPDLAPRAWRWYRRLLEHGLAVPFGVVCDLGHLLLQGEAFRFRSFFDDERLTTAERAVRERYESRVLLRRLQEAALARLRRVVLDNQDVDLAVSRGLEILLRPAQARLTPRFGIDEPHGLQLDFGTSYRRARDDFEAAAAAPGVLLGLLDQLADQATLLDLDRLLQAEDYYEIEHVRVFPRESLREVARRIKTVERLLGPTPRLTARSWRQRALAETSLESVGTYPTGGIAELSTSGPLENLVPSELVYLEPAATVDPFLVRYAENGLLRYLRDSAIHQMLRRSVTFVVDDCPEFNRPVTAGGELHGTKVIRCLLGLVLSLTADLWRIFRRDDLAFHLMLLAGEGGSEQVAERREIGEVLHLLFHEKEEAGTVRVELAGGSLGAWLAGLDPDPGRAQTVVLLGRPALLRAASGWRSGPQTRVVGFPVSLDDATAAAGVSLADRPLAALRRAREQLLSQVIA